jgi:hypothetical protein
MSHKLLVAFVAFVLTSCTTIKPTPIAYKCPKIILPTDPVVPVHALNANSKPDDVIKAWVATAVAYRDWNRVVRKQISSL